MPAENYAMVEGGPTPTAAGDVRRGRPRIGSEAFSSRDVGQASPIRCPARRRLTWRYQP